MGKTCIEHHRTTEQGKSWCFSCLFSKVRVCQNYIDLVIHHSCPTKLQHVQNVHVLFLRRNLLTSWNTPIKTTSKMVAACVWGGNDRRERIGFTLRHHMEARTFGLRIYGMKLPHSHWESSGDFFEPQDIWNILKNYEILEKSLVNIRDSFRQVDVLRFGGWDWSNPFWASKSDFPCTVLCTSSWNQIPFGSHIWVRSHALEATWLSPKDKTGLKLTTRNIIIIQCNVI